MSEKGLDALDIILARYHKQMLVLFDYALRRRYDDLFVLPYARDHEVAVGVLPDVHDRLAVDGWVADLILRDECIV